MSGTPFIGRYINLDRSAERRRDIEGELAVRGFAARYERFTAVDGGSTDRYPDIQNRPALGCYLSHLDLMRAHIGRPEWLHILEDDALINRFAEPIISATTSQPEFGVYDLIFTNVSFETPPAVWWLLRKGFDDLVELDAGGNVSRIKTSSVISLAKIDFKLTTSYLVNPRSVERVAALLAARLSAQRFDHIDTIYSKLSRAGELTAGLTIPFVTAPRLAMPSTTQPVVDPWELPLRIMDTALYADRDVADLRRRLDELEGSNTRGATGELISRAQSLLIAGVGV